MNDETLLHRIIKPHWWLQGNDVSSQAFRPGPEDDKQMSVYDGDQITAKVAWRHYTNDPSKSPPSGVMAVTTGECRFNRERKQQDLPVRPDPETFQEHVLINFRKFGASQTKKKSAKLRDAAVTRGWQFQP